MGRKSCQDCLDKRKTTAKARQEKLRADGLCYVCGQRPYLPKTDKAFLTCQTCYLRRLAVYHLKDSSRGHELLALLDTQEWKCYYSGETIVLGDNDSIDHSLPKSRYPDRATDITNMRWTTREVNHMKNNLTPDEFLAIIARISDMGH